MNLIKRVRKWRTDRLLAWVKPGKAKYTIVVYRRLDPDHAFEFEFDGENINEFQFVEMDYARTRLGALFVRFCFGRDKWSDGLRQQKVVIFPPDYSQVIFRDVLTPDTYPGEFDAYRRYMDMYGVAKTVGNEGDLYESITGHRSKVLDAYLNTKTNIDERDREDQIGKDFRRALDGPRKPITSDRERAPSVYGRTVVIESTPQGDGTDLIRDKFLSTFGGRLPGCLDDTGDEQTDKFTDTKLFSDYDNG